jgi:polar amino acid transport system substrate-binding protein
MLVVNVSWAQLIGGNTKNFDLALSEASITEPRKKVVDFSVPYFSSDIALLVKSGLQVDSASAKNLRIGVHQGTTGADFIRDVLKPTKPVQVYPNVPAMMAALTAGQIDAAADDTAYLLAYAKKSNGDYVVPGQYNTGETYGAVYPKGSPNEKTFDKIINAMKNDGTLKMLAEKYLAAAWGTDPATVPYFKP